MELIFILLILCLQKRQLSGASHFEESLDKQVFFINPWEDGELFIDGYRTGLLGTQLLFFPHNKTELVVQVQRKGQLLATHSLELLNAKSMIFLQAAPLALRSVK